MACVMTLWLVPFAIVRQSRREDAALGEAQERRAAWAGSGDRDVIPQVRTVRIWKSLLCSN
jgi:hypothetical protein